MLTWILTLLAILLTVLVLHRKNRYNLFKRMGINGPAPAFLIGNFYDMYKYGLLKCWEKWRNEYGGMYGYYEGPQPILVITDPEMIKQVFVKDLFSNFSGRRIFPMGRGPKHNPDIIQSEGQDWKRIRALSSPFFSGVRMKEMSPLINNSVGKLLNVLEEKANAGTTFDIYSVYQGLTMEVICACAFGTDLDAQVDTKHPVLLKARELFLRVSQRNALQIAAFLLPELRPLWFRLGRKLGEIFNNPFIYLREHIRHIIQMRRSQKLDRVDFINLMLSATEHANDASFTMTSDDSDTADQSTGTSSGDKETSSSLRKKGMTNEEMEANLMIFLLAGYETTSTALAYTSYRLALNPDVQQKLQVEIDEYFPDDDDMCPTYNSVQKLPYLDMVFSEVLRLHSIAPPIIARRCTKACTVKGVDIPEGVMVMADSVGLHMDKKYWGPEDPAIFSPDRFLPENKAKRDPIAWMPFGHGPRNCVGMRFALMEAKFALTRLLKKYTIHKTDELQIPLQIREGGTFVPKDGVMVSVSKRNE
ncbi:unnamed protein product [Owenia fusiformis]|uniref:Cytochrome P450 n=1 Tax=Owenia fusiformis TaxID=6347 RepID=A0A8S4N2M2_OWEFU|nr:unnamed protein product [Owenia fusiformis]